MRVVGVAVNLTLEVGDNPDLPVPVVVSILSRHVLSNQGGPVRSRFGAAT